MRFAILMIAVILSAAIQATWLSNIHLPLFIKPDLVFILVVSYGLLRGPYQGAPFGLIAGLFMDVVSGNVIGIGALVKMAAGFSAGLLEKTIFKDNLLVPALAVCVGTLVFESFNILMQLSFHANYHFFYTLVSVIGPLALYNGILAPALYFMLLKMEAYLAEKADSA